MRVAGAAWTSEARDITGAGQIVAVVDSGIDARTRTSPTSPRGAGTSSTDDADAGDGDGHGTHVSGTIAAVRDNGEGIAGIAPDARIMALRALDDEGGGFDSDIAEAFDWAGDRPRCPVVNASLGGEGASQTLRTTRSHNAPDTLFVVAAGNGGDDGKATTTTTRRTTRATRPEPNVAVRRRDATPSDDVAEFSNYGAAPSTCSRPGDGSSRRPGRRSPAHATRSARFRHAPVRSARHVDGRPARVGRRRARASRLDADA